MRLAILWRLALSSQSLLVAGALLLFFQLSPWLGGLCFPLEIASHFQLQGLGAAFFLLSLACLRRAKTAGFLLLMPLGLGLYHLSPYFLAKEIPDAPAEQVVDFKLISYNLLSDNAHPKASLDFLRAAAPDILFTCEVTEAWSRRLNQLEFLPHQANFPRIDNFGLSVRSRWPIEAVQVSTPTDSQVPLLSATIQTPSGPVRIVGAHPMPPINRAALADRDRCLMAATRYFDESAIPGILCGDFNLTRWSPSYRKIFRDSSLRNCRNGRGPSCTWAPKGMALLGLEIDHVMASEGLQLKQLECGPSSGSDHRPIIASFCLSR